MSASFALFSVLCIPWTSVGKLALVLRSSFLRKTAALNNERKKRSHNFRRYYSFFCHCRACVLKLLLCHARIASAPLCVLSTNDRPFR